jgi:hypothetical protein
LVKILATTPAVMSLVYRADPTDRGLIVADRAPVAEVMIKAPLCHFLIFLLILRNPVNPVYLSQGGAVFVEWFDVHDPSV